MPGKNPKWQSAKPIKPKMQQGIQDFPPLTPQREPDTSKAEPNSRSLHGDRSRSSNIGVNARGGAPMTTPDQPASGFKRVG